MKLLKKIFIIVAVFSCFSSFAVKDNYFSILKTAKVKTLSEFENHIQKDVKELVRGLSKKSVLVSIQEQKEETSKQVNLSEF